MERQGMKLIGYLQTLDKPLVSLFLNTTDKTLVVRLTIATQPMTESVVSIEDVRGYINGKYGLRKLMRMETIDRDAVFIDELCNERSRIEYFLNNSKQYLNS